MTIGIISHPDCLLHDMGTFHPESSQRVRDIDTALRQSNILNELIFYEAKVATQHQLERVHDPNYISWVFQKAPKEGSVDLDPDTSMNPFTLRAALYAAGAVIQGVDHVMNKEVNQVFCNVRPPGHHAERNQAMGFCFFNNIAVGVAYALQHYQLKKIAIVDFDVHHGNGTENIFQNESRVLLCSSYQYPFYPFNKVVQDNDHILHIPLSSGDNGETFCKAVSDLWLPALEKFEPDLIFISAGFDAHFLDPLASLRFKEEDYFWISEKVLDIANRFCEGKIVSSLEGGYAIGALGRSVVAHLSAFITS